MACPSIQFIFRLCCLVCLLGIQICATEAFAAKTVLVVLSQDSDVFQAYAQAFRQCMLQRDKTIRINVFDSDRMSGSTLPRADLYVAVGPHAAALFRQNRTSRPLLVTMMPRDSLEQWLPEQKNARGLYLDQPPARYLSLVRAALPHARRIGVLAGPDGKGSARRLRSTAHQMHLDLRLENVSSKGSIHSALRRLLPRVDALLTIPDATIFNRETIPNIMLEAYRHDVPVIGFSPAYLEAGALVALYSSPQQLAEQSADISHKVLSGSPVAILDFPLQYTIGINDHIAKSMNQAMDDTAVIRTRMLQQGRP